MKVVAFLPAKGQSSRISNKNLKLLDGQPLFLGSLKKLIGCDFIDDVYLDTEDQHIIDLASETGAKVLHRDPALASNATDGNALFRYETSSVEADIYIQMLCTSPFIEIDTIREGVECLKNNPEYDSVVLVKKEKQYQWSNEGPLYGIDPIPNSVDLPDSIIETMALYIVRKSCVEQTGRRIGDRPYLLEASPIEAVDVNWPEDFEMASLIAAGAREHDRRLLQNIRGTLSSAMLSDILDDLGFSSQIIKSLKPNFDCRILGRAKTLRLRAIRPDEDFRGIYQALESYKSIVPNDIILVENELEEYAYFGELNGNLAIRSGAVGAIIGGSTRDSSALRDLNFPVFSKGNTCQDVRKRAVLDHMNKTIEIDGVKIEPEELVFADFEGVVVIPKVVEVEVLKRCADVVKSEKQLILDISLGVDADELTEKYGFF